ncbi:MAG: diflavin flavoprotein [Cyanobacteria bacterium P01_H01_bin.121]
MTALTTPPVITNPPERDVQVAAIATDTMVLRSRSWNRLRFEMEYALERGTTANSYLIQGDRIAVIDPPGESFTEKYLVALEALVSLQAIDYIILGHINPNRAATLKALLKQAPQATIVCSNPAAKILQSLYDETMQADLPDYELKLLIQKGEDVLDLGQRHQLQFSLTPTPRWPGGLCTYDQATKILYTDKFYAAHICGEALFDEGWSEFLEDQRYYFDSVMASQAKQVGIALEKLTTYDALVYAPAHGPVLRYGRRGLEAAYQQWSQKQIQQTLKVALLYASAYGSTGTIARAIAQGISKAGVQVEMLNCEVATTDELRSALEQCNGFVIGSPTLGGHAPTPIQTALGIVISTVPKNRSAGVFGSFGWSGEAIDLLKNKLTDAGYKLGFAPIRVKFKPTDTTLKTCEEAGTDFAQALKRAKKKADRKAAPSLLQSQSAGMEQAVGRILGSLCVLTAKKGDVQSAMVASWVSQATFNPPGLTVAVAKDRAVESLTHTGDRFVLNILSEANYLPIQKHFLKPFKPGADRFDGIETQASDAGAPILASALAYLECKVQNRMECGDHWVVYAIVDQGKVLDEESKTAVHYRKTGRFY